jgi:hypothetical protein
MGLPQLPARRNRPKMFDPWFEAVNPNPICSFGKYPPIGAVMNRFLKLPAGQRTEQTTGEQSALDSVRLVPEKAAGPRAA